MRILDFMNEAWLRGRYSQGSTEEIKSLRNLQEFAGNPYAEVQAYDGGLLVFDLHRSSKDTQYFPQMNGQLYYVSTNGIIPLTGTESKETLEHLTRVFLSSSKYSAPVKECIERFKQDYQNGAFNNDQPEQ